MKKKSKKRERKNSLKKAQTLKDLQKKGNANNKGESNRDLLQQLMLTPKFFDAREASPGKEPPDSICKRRNDALSVIL